MKNGRRGKRSEWQESTKSFQHKPQRGVRGGARKREMRNCGSMGHAGLTPPQKALSSSSKEGDQKVKGSSGGGPWFVLDPFLLTLLAHELCVARAHRLQFFKLMNVRVYRIAPFCFSRSDLKLATMSFRRVLSKGQQTKEPRRGFVQGDPGTGESKVIKW